MCTLRLNKIYHKGLIGCLLCALLAIRVASAEDSAFGTSSGTEAALIGILYDLKQTQQGEPSGVTNDTFREVIGEFLASEWDEGVLNRHFRVSRPVYATRIFMRLMSADQAPKAFGVGDVVKPKLWLVHYKGQVVVPMDGVYRIAGYADDFIAARINGKTVMVTSRKDCIPKGFEWKQPASEGMTVANGRLGYGQWVSLKAGEVIDLDVLVGERPGGYFGAWLYIQRKGETYPMKGNHPVLPAFQFSDSPVTKSDVGFSPPRPSSVWKALQ